MSIFSSDWSCKANYHITETKEKLRKHNKKGCKEKQYMNHKTFSDSGSDFSVS